MSCMRNLTDHWVSWMEFEVVFSPFLSQWAIWSGYFESSFNITQNHLLLIANFRKPCSHKLWFNRIVLISKGIFGFIWLWKKRRNVEDLVIDWLTAKQLTQIYIYFYPTTNNLVSLERKECIRYLGVLIDSNLYWKYHIDYISLKTRLALTSVLRPFGVTRWIDVLFGVTGMSDYLWHTWGLPNLSYDCDLWKHLVFRLLLALCWLM